MKLIYTHWGMSYPRCGYAHCLDNDLLFAAIPWPVFRGHGPDYTLTL